MFRDGASLRASHLPIRGRRFPPLLGGEGRGEGETDDPTAECVPIVASAEGWAEEPNGFEPFIVSSEKPGDCGHAPNAGLVSWDCFQRITGFLSSRVALGLVDGSLQRFLARRFARALQVSPGGDIDDGQARFLGNGRVSRQGHQ